MKRLLPFVFAACLVSNSPASASGAKICIDDANRIDITSAFTSARQYISKEKRRIGELQLLLYKDEAYSGAIDGEMNKELAASLCGSLKNYIAIMGSDPRVIFKRPIDIENYIKWLYDVVFANETGGEYPD